MNEDDIEQTTVEDRVILIVEDDETSFILLKALLTPLKYNLLWANNGEQAIRLFSQNPKVDLILMDMKMPVMDGYEATRRIRKLSKNIPIIAQSAYALSGDNEKAFDVGCNDYVTKPIKKEELIRKVNRWINNR